MLLAAGIAQHNLWAEPDGMVARELLDGVSRKTLGQLIKVVQSKTLAPPNLLDLFRRNSDEGRTSMLDDLENIHHSILKAYKAVMLLSGVGLEKLPPFKPPGGHLPI